MLVRIVFLMFAAEKSENIEQCLKKTFLEPF
jgi:hypothetical protein